MHLKNKHVIPMPRKYNNRSTHFILHDDGTFDVYIDKKFKECGLYEETPDTIELNYYKDSAIFQKEEGCLISENHRIWLEDRVISVPGGILNNGIFIANCQNEVVSDFENFINEDYINGSRVEEIIGELRVRAQREEEIDFTNTLIEGEKKETEG
ncbi:MAG: hypothetical protein ACPK85_14085 [Methanosarcina sp.]